MMMVHVAKIIWPSCHQNFMLSLHSKKWNMYVELKTLKKEARNWVECKFLEWECAVLNMASQTLGGVPSPLLNVGPCYASISPLQVCNWMLFEVIIHAGRRRVCWLKCNCWLAIVHNSRICPWSNTENSPMRRTKAQCSNCQDFPYSENLFSVWVHDACVSYERICCLSKLGTGLAGRKP